jgi:hypothetical protein
MMNSFNRCIEITLRNTQCKKRKRGESYCSMHFKECSICLNEINDPVLLSCNHLFCKECIYRWIVKSGNCPMCRNQVLYRERLDAINNNVYNGNLITVTSYRFTLDTTLFPDFYDYTNGLIELDTYLPRQDWELFKIFVGIDERMYRIFRNIPCMKFISYVFVDDYTDSFPIEYDENETKNVFKYKIETI